MELKLKGKKALVMGSSQGIGKAVAEQLVKEGAMVCLNSRSKTKLQEVAREIEAQGFVQGDLTFQGEGRRVVEQAIEQLQGLDILVTNTGGPAKGNFLQITKEQWQQDFQSLWMSVTEALGQCLPHMQKNSYGRIIMLTSVAAQEPIPGLTTSNGLRAGLTGLAKSIANEYAPYGITVNALLPGYTNTERLKALNISDEKIKAMVPIGRLVEPEEIGHLAAYLASPLASSITGQAIAIDGGSIKGH